MPRFARTFPLAVAVALALTATPAHATGGEIDPSFASGGKVVTPVGDGNAFALDTDFSIDGLVSAGYADVSDIDPGTPGDQAGRALALTKIEESNGTLDTDFGDGGTVVLAKPGYDFRADAVMSQAPFGGGQFVVAGSYVAQGVGGTRTMWVGFFTSNGQLTAQHDITLGGDHAEANAIAIGADSKVVVAGSANTNLDAARRFVAVRFNLDGTKDDGLENDSTPGDGFGAQGVSLVPNGILNDALGNAVAIDAATGGPVIAGEGVRPGVDRRMAVVRLDDDGMVDTGWGSDGWWFSNGTDTLATAIALESDGDVVVGGRWSTDHFGVARIDGPTGTRDLDWALGSSPASVFVGSGASLADLFLETNGRVVASGTGGGHAQFARFNTNGFLDNGFGTTGVFQMTTGTSSAATGMLPKSWNTVLDHTAYAAGYATENGRTRFTLSRILLDGAGSGAAPVVTTSPGPTAYAAGGSPVVVDDEVTVSDGDDTELTSATVEIAEGHQPTDELTLVATPPIDATYDSAEGLLTLSGTASVAEYEAALKAVTYGSSSPTPGHTRTLHFRAYDDTNQSPLATKEVAISGGNAPPAITIGTATTSYTEDAGAVPVAPALGLTDDGGWLIGATVRVSENHEPGDELFHVDGGGILGSFDNATGVLTLSGTASVTAYRDALRAVSFGRFGAPTKPSKKVEFTATDGTATSAPATRSLQRVAPPVRPKPPVAPTNVTRPSITGDAVVGGRLTATAGTWRLNSRNEASYYIAWYRWQVCDAVLAEDREAKNCTDIAPVVGRQHEFQIPAEYRGKRLRVAVTVHGDDDTQTTAYSLPAPVVKDPGPPIDTLCALDMGSDQFSILAYVNPKGKQTEVWTETASRSPGPGVATTTGSHQVLPDTEDRGRWIALQVYRPPGVADGRIFWYRVWAKNADGTMEGGWKNTYYYPAFSWGKKNHSSDCTPYGSAPTATTGPASLDGGRATLRGTVNAQGVRAIYHFQVVAVPAVGADPRGLQAYYSGQALQAVYDDAADHQVAVKADVEEKTYAYRTIVTSAYGRAYGEWRYFTSTCRCNFINSVWFRNPYEDATVTSTVTWEPFDPRQVKRLAIAARGKGIVIGRRTIRNVDAGEVKLRIKVSKKGRKRLKKVRRKWVPVTIKTRIVSPDPKLKPVVLQQKSFVLLPKR